MLSAHSCWAMQWLKYATAPECQGVLEDTAALLGPGHHSPVVSAQCGASWACAHVCTTCEAVNSQPHSLTSQQGANTHCKVRTAMLLASTKAAVHAKQVRA